MGLQLASNRRASRSLILSGENVLGKTPSGDEKHELYHSTLEWLVVLYTHPPNQTHEPSRRNN